MPNLTTNYSFYLPLVDDPTDQDLWGGYLNSNITTQDAMFSVALNWVPTSETASFNIVAPTAASSTLGSTKNLFICDASSGAITGSLPAASSCSGMVVGFKKKDSSSNAVTIDPAGSDTIDGAASFVLSAQYSYVFLVSNGSTWEIITQSILITTLPNGTVATTQAYTDTTTKVATDQFVNGMIAAQTASSISSNGYQKLPSGLIIQWGTASTINEDSQLTVTYPLAFPTACLMALASAYNWSIGGTAGPSIGVYSFGQSSMILQNDNTAASATWLALGY